MFSSTTTMLRLCEKMSADIKIKKSDCSDKDHSIKNTNPLFLDKEAGAEIKMPDKRCFACGDASCNYALMN